MHRSARTLLCAVAAGATLLAACGDDDKPATTTPITAAPVTSPAGTTAGAGTVTAGSGAAASAEASASSAGSELCTALAEFETAADSLDAAAQGETAKTAMESVLAAARRVAEVAIPDLRDDGAKMVEGLEQMQGIMERAGYDSSKVSDADKAAFQKLNTDQGYKDAFDAIEGHYDTNCSTGSSTVSTAG